MRVRGLAFLLAFTAVGVLTAQSLTICCEDEPPNQFVGPDGLITGMSVDIVTEIQRRIGNQDPIQMMPWARAYDAALKSPDTVLFTVSRTAERNPLFNWVGPVHELCFSFYAKADSPIRIRNLAEARKLRRVGVYLDDVRDTLLTRAGFMNLDRASNNLQNFKKLMAGRIDVFASSPEAIEAEAIQAGFESSAVKHVFTFARVQDYIVLSKGTPEPVVKAWAKAFAGMQKDGSFAGIHRKYYPDQPLPGKAITEF
jgi:polar amino acid transport system substrate-binding protein